jgi:hypothetical protein
MKNLHWVYNSTYVLAERKGTYRELTSFLGFVSNKKTNS